MYKQGGTRLTTGKRGIHTSKYLLGTSYAPYMMPLPYPTPMDRIWGAYVTIYYWTLISIVFRQKTVNYFRLIITSQSRTDFRILCTQPNKPDVRNFLSKVIFFPRQITQRYMQEDMQEDKPTKKVAVVGGGLVRKIAYAIFLLKLASLRAVVLCWFCKTHQDSCTVRWLRPRGGVSRELIYCAPVEGSVVDLFIFVDWHFKKEA